MDDERWTGYRYQHTNETVAHLIAKEGGSIDHLQKLPNESLMEPNAKGTKVLQLIRDSCLYRH